MISFPLRRAVARLVPLLVVLSLLGAPAPALAQGAVSTADPRATAAGKEILAKGGSAADAAIAVMLALTIVEPQSSGIGGGGFLLYQDAAGGALATIDGRETAPAAARADRFMGADGKPMGYAQSVPGGLSVGVPGNIRLAEAAHRKWGKLPWADVFKPAIRLAEDGFAVTPVLHNWLGRFEELWRDFPETRALYYVDGKPAAVGTVIRNPALASLLRDVAARGADAFYHGQNARTISAVLAASPRNPAVMTAADLANYRARERDPVCAPYRQYRVCGMGPPSSGATTVLGILGMLERYDLAAMGQDSAMSWHLLAEAMRFAYADREQYLADPDFADVPTAGLTDRQYLAGRRMLISPFRAAGTYPHGTPPGAPARARPAPRAENGTTHFSIADRDGNVAAYTSTIESVFGSHLVANGYFLNNELTDFDLSPTRGGLETANRVQPGKRPLSSMSPTIVYGPDGKVVLAVGSAGGKRIIMHVTKTLIGVMDWGLSAEAAIALPNIYFDGRGVLIEDNDAGRAIAEKMAPFGYGFTPISLPSKLNAVEPAGDGWRGAADPRSPGTADTDDGAPPQA